MQKFTIYPKDGEPFTLECERFEARDNRFLLYDAINQESREGFLSFEDVAAIVPERQLARGAKFYPNNPITFLVYLRGKPKPIEVIAFAFRADNQPRVTFLGQRRDMLGNMREEWIIEDVYVATAEVIAILPSDGLVSR